MGSLINENKMKNIDRSKVYLIVAAFWIAMCLIWSTKAHAQQSWCDSLTYQTFPNPTLTVTGNSNGLSNIVGSIDWNWTACNSIACYTPQGNNPYSFPLINPTDTVKLCYDAFIYYDSTMMICNHCDSLVYSQNLYSWIIFSTQGNTTSLPGFVIEEDGIRWWNDIMYDMLGKEITEVPIGTMYIRGGKLYKRIK